MRYHFDKPEIYLSLYGERYICEHPVYNSCTLYRIEKRGLAVIQQRFDSETKSTWWSEVDPWITDALYLHPDFREYFEMRAGACTIAVFATRVDAEKVYSQMLELSTQYGAVSVNDYYELCGLEDKDSYELRNYGWTKDAVLNMSVVRIGPNYVIDVPRIVQCFQMKGENHA